MVPVLTFSLSFRKRNAHYDIKRNAQFDRKATHSLKICGYNGYFQIRSDAAMVELRFKLGKMKISNRISKKDVSQKLSDSCPLEGG